MGFIVEDSAICINRKRATALLDVQRTGLSAPAATADGIVKPLAVLQAGLLHAIPVLLLRRADRQPALRLSTNYHFCGTR
jgi:hypothetical protein